MQEAHFELLAAEPDVRYFIVRIFESPLGPIEPETGQPWKAYEAIFLLQVKGQEGEIKGALGLPRNPLHLIRAHAKTLGLKSVSFERWIGRKKRRITIPIT